MKYISLFAVVLSLICSNALACEQEPDKIIYGKKVYYVNNDPVYSFFSAYPEKQLEFVITSTGLYKGYIATYQISDRKLLITEIVGAIRFEGIERMSGSVFNMIFGDQKPFHLTTYSGILILPYDEEFNVTNIGSTLLSGKYILLEIKHGMVTGTKHFDNDGFGKFREMQFMAYKKTEAYKQKFASLKDEKWSEDKVNSFILEHIMDYTDEFLENNL